MVHTLMELFVWTWGREGHYINTKMSSDFNFTIVSLFLGNVRIKPYFNTLRGQFLYPERGRKQTFFDPLPLHLVHVVIECPLRSFTDCTFHEKNFGGS